MRVKVKAKCTQLHCLITGNVLVPPMCEGDNAPTVPLESQGSVATVPVDPSCDTSELNWFAPFRLKLAAGEFANHKDHAVTCVTAVGVPRTDRVPVDL